MEPQELLPCLQEFATAPLPSEINPVLVLVTPFLILF
jgi:hypothetical protein